MSNADRRTVATDALETLGKIIGESEKRDAIHLAVEPAVAASILRPGDHVGFTSDGRVGVCDNPLGIVDPFLTGFVQPGQRFWLVVYPRQITSLRHVWEHPAFPPTTADGATMTAMGTSEKWLRDFASGVGLKYEVIMAGARDWVFSKEAGTYGKYLCFGGLLEGQYVPDEFWPHYEQVTGTKVAEKHRGSFFTCSC